MDAGTISIVVILGLVILLAIGMPLGLASASLALVVLVLKFEATVFTDPWCYLIESVYCEDLRIPGMLTARPGTGAIYIAPQKIFDLMTEYVLLSVPLFILMAALLERSGIAKGMYDALDYWLSSVRGGIAVVTSLMAVIMAAMSGIIGGEVVLLGLIALPQMLRLGYNQNLAIGTICASGSLGTMIPPSIVLIIYGLITETSIKNLFTGAFIPGFMLASFIIIYILIRVNLDPSQAPLPDRSDEEEAPAPSPLGSYILLAIAVAPLVLAGIGIANGTSGFGAVVVPLIFAAAVGSMAFSGKGQMFASFLAIMGAAGATVLLARALFFLITGQYVLEEGEDPIRLGMPYHIPYIVAWLAVFLILALGVLGLRRSALGWTYGKGLVAPFTIIGVVLGSIYGGITGITEAAGMGALAVFLISIIMDRSWEEWKAFWATHRIKTFIVIGGTAVAATVLSLAFGGEQKATLASMVFIVVFFYWCMRAPGKVPLIWDGLMRTLRSTGTIIWVTIGAAALAGAYTLAGGPTFIAKSIVGSEMSTMLVLLTMMVILLFMGAFMDWVGIVLLIIPVFLPIVKALPISEIGLIGELDPKYVSVWFGVLFCMNMQVSFLSPPFGPAAFYLKSVAPAHISLTDIFKGFLPFICIQLLALSVLLIWPPIVEILLK